MVLSFSAFMLTVVSLRSVLIVHLANMTNTLLSPLHILILSPSLLLLIERLGTLCGAYNQKVTKRSIRHLHFPRLKACWIQQPVPTRTKRPRHRECFFNDKTGYLPNATAGPRLNISKKSIRRKVQQIIFRVSLNLRRGRSIQFRTPLSLHHREKSRCTTLITQRQLRGVIPMG